MNIGDRMKRYEESFHHVLVRRMPVMIRVDGRAFHTLTRGLDKPFSHAFMDAMVNSALDLAEDMQGFKAAYIQSDEASFCITDYDTIDTQGWFDYDHSKLVSISAAIMTARFNEYFGCSGHAVFDSRAFNVPIADVANAFLWRAKDWQRNSIQMYCQSVFSHKQLQGKKQPDMHEMLHDKGLNWTTDLTEQERNGTFLLRQGEGIVGRSDILPNFEAINSVIGFLFKEI